VTAAVPAPPDDAPRQTHWGATICPVTDWHEGLEALRAPTVSADCGGPGDEYYRQGTVMRLDGEAHQRRRRAIMLLLRRGGHQWYRDTVLIPTAKAEMAKLLQQRDADGAVRVDLRAWLERVNMQLSAAFIGLDAGRSDEGAATLTDFVVRHLRGFPGAIGQTVKGFDLEDEATQDGLAVHEAFRERFFEPAYQRRVELVRQVEAGELDESELPHDLITLYVRELDPAWADHDLTVREAFFFLPAASATTAVTTAFTLGELFAWFEAHPEDVAKQADSAFLRRATEETLRLHPVVQALARIATDDITLCKGTQINKGDLPTVILGPGDLDTEVYGPDAAEFNPYRDVPHGVPRYGLAFGGGPHMCLGIPLAMGQEGIDGNVVFWLKTLLAAGVARDPDNPAPPMHELRGVHRRLVEERYTTAFPVMFAPGS
jgi:cytochrome P450